MYIPCPVLPRSGRLCCKRRSCASDAPKTFYRVNATIDAHLHHSFDSGSSQHGGSGKCSAEDAVPPRNPGAGAGKDFNAR